MASRAMFSIAWFASYLRRADSLSKRKIPDRPPLSCGGVPQGSVLGPILYTLCPASLADRIRKYGLQFHLYADDCQIYVPFKPGLKEESAALLKIEACTIEIYAWMACNKLKLIAITLSF